MNHFKVYNSVTVHTWTIIFFKKRTWNCKGRGFTLSWLSNGLLTYSLHLRESPPLLALVPESEPAIWPWIGPPSRHLVLFRQEGKNKTPYKTLVNVLNWISSGARICVRDTISCRSLLLKVWSQASSLLSLWAYKEYRFFPQPEMYRIRVCILTSSVSNLCAH